MHLKVRPGAWHAELPNLNSALHAWSLAHQVKAGGFMQRLLQIKPLELQRRQEAMRHARSLIRFDFSGAKPDAFTQVVQETFGCKVELSHLPVRCNCAVSCYDFCAWT